MLTSMPTRSVYLDSDVASSRLFFISHAVVDILVTSFLSTFANGDLRSENSVLYVWNGQSFLKVDDVRRMILLGGGYGV